VSVPKVKLIIPGRPVPAVRMTQRSKFKSRQAQRYLDFKTSLGWEARRWIRTPSAKDFEVNAVAYISPTKDMDVDNLAKSYLDGLNGVVWIDDKQVVKLTVEKRFVFRAEEQRSEIEIKEAGS